MRSAQVSNCEADSSSPAADRRTSSKKHRCLRQASAHTLRSRVVANIEESQSWPTIGSPGFMWAESGCLVAAGAVAGFTPISAASIALGASLLMSWIVLDAGYVAARSGALRTQSRQRRDHHIALQCWLVSASLVAIGIASQADHHLWVWHSTAQSVAFAAIATLAFLVYASSLFDWYYIRSRLDGVVCEPPCRSSRSSTWRIVTRLWFLQRTVAELLGLTVTVVALTAITLTLSTARLRPGIIVIFALGFLFCLGLVARGALHTLRFYVFAEPRYCVGDLLIGRRGERWYVLRITMRGLFASEWDPGVSDWRAPIELSHARLQDECPARHAFAGCGACCKVNRQCEWADTGHARGTATRKLIS